jgi:rhodanese-related sulfurtransferase
VRTPEEYEAGHAAMARHAPGGQLVQATDEFIGVLGSRVVLVDDESLVRATMTASWLVQFGRYEVVVARLDDSTTTGPDVVASLVPLNAPTIEATELAARSGRVTVVDLADSLRYRRGHIPGSWWAIRSRFDEATGVTRPVVLTSPDGELARAAHEDAERHWPGTTVLGGGTAAWTALGYPLEEGPGRPSTGADDVSYKPYDEDRAVAHERMRDYLEWEVALPQQIDGDELVRFRHFPVI